MDVLLHGRGRCRSKKKQHLSTKALKRPTNTAIDLMVNKSLERICKLNPRRSKH